MSVGVAERSCKCEKGLCRSLELEAKAELEIVTLALVKALVAERSWEGMSKPSLQGLFMSISSLVYYLAAAKARQASVDFSKLLILFFSRFFPSKKLGTNREENNVFRYGISFYFIYFYLHLRFLRAGPTYLTMTHSGLPLVQHKGR